MTNPQNCWEHTKCGREPGGRNVNELGICPASTLADANGINSGKNGGRSCWAISGTFCEGKVQGSFASKSMNCLSCAFFRAVWKEENEKAAYTETKDILKILHTRRG